MLYIGNSVNSYLDQLPVLQWSLTVANERYILLVAWNITGTF